MADPTSKLRFQGDERDLGKALDRVQDKMSGTSKVISKESAKAESSLRGIKTAADLIKDVKFKADVETAVAEGKIRGIAHLSPEVVLRLEAEAAVAEAKEFERRYGGKDVNQKLKIDTSQAEGKIKALGSKAGGDAGRDAGGAFSGKFMGALAGVGFASTLSKIAADAFAASADKVKLTAGLQNQMGITPAEAKMYGDRVGKAYAGGLGDSKEQIGQVYATLSSDAKGWSSMTMAAQDDIARGMTKVVQGLGVDLPQAAKGASAAFTNGLVPSFKAAEDLLVTGYQTLGSRGDDWAETLGEYSQYFKNLGFDGATALGVIQQGLQAGARDTDYIADAFKELNIRVIDGSKEVGGALKELGLNAKTLPQEIVKGGPAALAAVDSIIDRIKQIKDPIKQNAVGVALFGTQWEDTMKQIVGAIDINSAQMNTKYQGAVDKMAVATDSNVERFQRRWETGLGKVGDNLSKWANDGAAIVDGFATNMANTIDKKVGANNPFKAITESMEKLNQMRVDIKVSAEWQKVQDIHGRLMKLPPKTPVVVDALTANAIGDLERLGYKVRTLPGGKVEVSANTKPATDQAARTVAWLNSLYANITVGVVGPGKNYALKNTKGGMAAFAKGGVVQGPGGVDNVPIWASAGEHITAEKYARDPNNARILEAINSGRPWQSAMTPPGSSSSPGGGNAGGSGGGRSPGVTFNGSLDTAVASMIMALYRDGKITFS